MDNINIFLDMQREAIIKDFSDIGSCFVSLSEKKLWELKQNRGWSVEPISGCRKENALIIRKSSNHEPECWVLWNYTGYRRAYTKFLEHYYPEFRNALNSSIHVDHLEPKYRFSTKSNHFVRLHLVPKEINTAYGSGFERNFFESERRKKLPNATYMSWLTFSKAYGERPPKKSSGTHVWDSWAFQLANKYHLRTGDSEFLAYFGLLNVLRLGYTGFYSGSYEPVDMQKMQFKFNQMKINN